jgi:hypothetical protein
MQHLRIRILPHIVNALILTTVFSAGNTLLPPPRATDSFTLFPLSFASTNPLFLNVHAADGGVIYPKELVKPWSHPGEVSPVMYAGEVAV